MNWFPLGPMIHLTALTTDLIIIIIILVRNPYGESNRFAAALFFCFAVWNFSRIFLDNPFTPQRFAVLFERIGAVGWVSFPVFAFWFLVSLTKKKNPHTSSVLIFTSIALPVFFITVHLLGFLTHVPELHEDGWLSGWIQGSVFPYLFYVYCIGSVACGFLYYALSQDKFVRGFKKEQSFVLYLSSGIALAAVIFFNVIIPMFHLKTDVFEDITDICVFLWSLSVFFIILKYKFLALTPASASESIISAMNEALILLDDDTNISYVNQPALEMLGYREGELKGRPFNKLIYDKSAVNLFLAEVIKKHMFKSNEFILTRGDGAPLSCIFSASLIMEAGEIRGIVCVANDITALKNAESDMREERDKVQNYMQDLKDHYYKLKELEILKSNFTSMVSHELRTPITSIKGFISFLLGGVGGPLSLQQKEFIGIIKNNSDRLLTLINDLLDTSKMESGSFSINKTQADLIPIIDTGIKDVRSLSENKKISIVNESSFTSCIISVDAYRFSQALVNLINNAIKFSPANSKITVRVDRHKLEEISIPAYADSSKTRPGNYTRVSIEDQGYGIAPEKLTRIFDKYYQVEDINTRKAQGTGLGLNIVKNIIELHGGAVWAESKGAGLGATFIMIVPDN